MTDKHVELAQNMKTTAGCRFIAHKRLLALDASWTRITALTSAYVIVLTAAPYFLSLPDRVEDHVNLVTLALAVIILVASLVQYSSNNAATAEQFHRSALEINEVRRDLEAQNPAGNTLALTTFSDRYGSILQKYSINQDDIDYFIYQLERPEDFPWLSDPKKKKGVERMQRAMFWSRHWATISISSITAIWLLLIFAYALPNQQTHSTLTECPLVQPQ